MLQLGKLNGKDLYSVDRLDSAEVSEWSTPRQLKLTKFTDINGEVVKKNSISFASLPLVHEGKTYKVSKVRSEETCDKARLFVSYELL